MRRENGGWEMYVMIEVEKYSCNDRHRREAEKRENELMKELKASMNKIKNFRTEEDKRQYKEEYDEKIKEQRKQINEDYKEKIKQYIIKLIKK
jgi:TRAP-type C4-dicarboxylate transport system substrate-binding protein